MCLAYVELHISGDGFPNAFVRMPMSARSVSGGGMRTQVPDFRPNNRLWVSQRGFRIEGRVRMKSIRVTVARLR